MQSMMQTAKTLGCFAVVALLALGCEQKSGETKPGNAANKPAPGKKAPAEKAGGEKPGGEKTGEKGKDGVDVELCDGETTVKTAVPTSRPEAQALAESLMRQWKQKNPDVDWEAEERKSRTFIPSHDNTALIDSTATGDPEEGAGAGVQEHPYRKYSKQDVLTWKRATERAVVAGSKVFHDADALGSTVAVSCDMCHPNGANTHPETYPKYQTQLGKVVLLRDMINWCLQHPVRAEAMAADDPRMRAMEAYIISQRAGHKLAYGKH